MGKQTKQQPQSYKARLLKAAQSVHGLKTIFFNPPFLCVVPENKDYWEEMAAIGHLELSLKKSQQDKQWVDKCEQQIRRRWIALSLLVMQAVLNRLGNEPTCVVSPEQLTLLADLQTKLSTTIHPLIKTELLPLLKNLIDLGQKRNESTVKKAGWLTKQRLKRCMEILQSGYGKKTTGFLWWKKSHDDVIKKRPPQEWKKVKEDLDWYDKRNKLSQFFLRTVGSYQKERALWVCYEQGRLLNALSNREVTLKETPELINQRISDLSIQIARLSSRSRLTPKAKAIENILKSLPLETYVTERFEVVKEEEETQQHHELYIECHRHEIACMKLTLMYLKEIEAFAKINIPYGYGYITREQYCRENEGVLRQGVAKISINAVLNKKCADFKLHRDQLVLQIDPDRGKPGVSRQVKERFSQVTNDYYTMIQKYKNGEAVYEDFIRYALDKDKFDKYKADGVARLEAAEKAIEERKMELETLKERERRFEMEAKVAVLQEEIDRERQQLLAKLNSMQGQNFPIKINRGSSTDNLPKNLNLTACNDSGNKSMLNPNRVTMQEIVSRNNNNNHNKELTGEKSAEMITKQQEKTIKLKNGQQITIEYSADDPKKATMNVAVIVPITDHRAIKELGNRCKLLPTQHGDIAEGHSHFHISILLCFPELSTKALTDLVALTKNRLLEMLTKPILATLKETKLFDIPGSAMVRPVVQVDSPALQELHQQLLTTLPNEIRYQRKYTGGEYQPHISLTVSPIQQAPIDELSAQSSTEEITFELNDIQLSHKNTWSHFVEITENEAYQLSSSFNKSKQQHNNNINNQETCCVI